MLDPDPQVRSTSVSYLQRAVVAAEALAIDAACLEKSLEIMILPLMKDLSKALGGREMPQVGAPGWVGGWALARHALVTGAACVHEHVHVRVHVGMCVCMRTGYGVWARALV